MLPLAATHQGNSHGINSWINIVQRFDIRSSSPGPYHKGHEHLLVLNWHEEWLDRLGTWAVTGDYIWGRLDLPNQMEPKHKGGKSERN